MDPPQTADLVLVHLLDAEAPQQRTTKGICAAFDIGTSVSERVELLSALSSLTEQGFLAETDGSSDHRTVYELTDDGVERASQLRTSMADQSVEVIEQGEQQTRSLSAAMTALELPSVASVAAQTANGTIHVDAVPESTFVGRDDALERLQTCLQSVEDGEAQTATILGERGVGKTELLRKFIEDIETTIIPITCRSDSGEPFGPVRDALADIGSADIFDRSTQELGDSGALLDRRMELFREVRATIASLSMPVLLVDDFHDADPETADLVEYLAEQLPAETLLLVTARPAPSGTDVFGAGGFDAATAIELEPLDRALTRELVIRQLGDRSVPSSLTDRLYEQTGGVPLFVRETVAELREQGVIDPAASVYPTDDTPLPIPEQIADAIERRLDALDARAHQILEDAAIIGHEIDTAILVEMSEYPESVVTDHVDLFADVGLFEPQGDPRFRSEAIREAVLDRIPADRLKQRNEAVAAAYRSCRSELPHATIARHYEAAGQLEAALDYHRRAGDEALDVYAHEAALDHYERALSLARDLDADDVLVEIVESIGRVHYGTGNYEEADRYFEYLRESTDDPELIQRSYRYQAEMASDRGDLDLADEYVDAGIDAVEEPNRVTCRLIGHKGWYQLQRGNIDAAEEIFERQHVLAQELDDQDRLGGAHHNLGTAAFHRGDTEAAVDHLTQAVAANESVEALRDAAASHNNLSMVYNRLGQLDKAIEHLETAREISADVDNLPTELTALSNLALYYHQRGRLEQARSTIDTVLEDARAMGLSGTLAAGLTSDAGLLIDQCQFDHARGRIEEAIELHEAGDNARMAANARLYDVRLALYENRHERAREQLEKVRQSKKVITPEVQAWADCRLGDYHRSQEAFEDAIEAYEEALSAAKACHNKQTQTMARLRLGATRSDLTNGEHGIETAQQAVDDAETFDAPMIQARAWMALAHCHRNTGEYDAAATALDTAAERIAGIEVPLYHCWEQVERALLAAERGDDDADSQLEAAANRAEERGISMLVTRCRAFD